MKFKNLYKNISILLTGTVIAQIIPLLMSPVLTRIYSPAEFGILAVFISFTTILAVFANFRLDTAIMSAESNEEKEILRNLSIYSTLIFVSILIIFLIIFEDFVKRVYSTIKYEYILIFIPIFVFLFGMLQLYTYINNSNGRYTEISKSKIDKNVSMAFIQLLLGYLNMGVKGLIIGTVACMVFPIYRLRKTIFMDKNHYNFKTYVKVLTKYKKYPLISTSSGFMDTLALESPILFMSKYQDQTTVGFFDLARKTIIMPLSFISISVSQVYFKQVVEENDSNKNIKITLSILLGLTIIAVIIGPIFFIWGGEIYSFIFGENWSIVGEYLKILIFPFLIKFIVSPLSVVFLIPNNIIVGTVWQFMHLVTNVAVAIIFLPKSMESYLLAFAVSEIISYLIYLILILFVIKRK